MNVSLVLYLAWAMEIRTLLKYFHRLHRLEVILDLNYISDMGSEVDVEKPLMCECLQQPTRSIHILPELPKPHLVPKPAEPSNLENPLEMTAKCEIPESHGMYKLPALSEEIFEMTC